MADEGQLLNISKFAELVNVNRKTLIFYDSIDLLKPAHTSDNGYRYYSKDQIDQITAIKILSELGVSLKEMKGYLDNRDIKSAETILSKQRKEVSAQIEHLRFVREMIDVRLELLSEGSYMDYQLSNSEMDSSVSRTCKIVKQTNVVPIYTMQTNASKQNPPETVQAEYYQSLPSAGIPMGFPFGYIVSKENLLSNNHDIAESLFFRLKRKAHANSTMPIGSYLVAHDYTPYGFTERIYADMLAYAQEQGIQVVGDGFEEYQIDEIATADSDKYLVRVSIQIEDQ